MNNQLIHSHSNVLKNNIFQNKLKCSKKRIIAKCILGLSLGFSLNTHAIDTQNLAALNQGEVRLLRTGESYRFVDGENNPIARASFNRETLKTRLGLAKDTYDAAIKNIQNNAYRELKGKIEPHICEEYVNILFTNYLDEENIQERIDITGSSPSEKEAKNFNQYMMLCDAVYTNFSTRAFVMQHNLATVKTRLNRITNQYNEITRLNSALEELRTNESRRIIQHPSIQSNGGLFGLGLPYLAIPGEILDPFIESNYGALLRGVNSFLEFLKKRDEVIDENNIHSGLAEYRNHIQDKLTVIQGDIKENYDWYFEENSRDPISWVSDIDSKVSLDRIPMFNGRQLTPKAVIGFSFLNQAGLLDNENITLIDVGFRNQTRYGGAWNSFVTNLMKFKTNPEAWFQRWGEVDYIAYIDKGNAVDKKDKLFIVYSGSNSDVDWGIDLTFGTTSYLGLAVHQGIGWLSETSNGNYQRILMQRIRNYYKRNSKPSELEIITTGHSLGGALAELSAYRYKTKVFQEFKDIVGSERIKIKTYTFGAPAIVDENSKRTMEGALGKENIFRIWAYGDPVADDVKRSTLSPIEMLRYKGLELTRSKHVGRSFVLYNIQNHNFGSFDWWGKHGVDRYRSFLHHLDSPDYTQQISKFEEELNNYIRVKGLFGFRKHKSKILEITAKLNDVDAGRLVPSIVLDRNLATRIIRYTPTTIKLNPPSSVGVALQSAHSPRYAASLSPRFTVEESGNLYSYQTNVSNSSGTSGSAVKVKRTSNLLYNRHEITATFRIEGQVIDFPINKDTPCSIQAVKQFLNDKGLYLPDEDIQPFSCGAFLAKHIFVSQYVTFPSYYHGVAGRMDVHLDTLTKIYQGCIDEKVCTPKYLIETSRQNNALKQALGILSLVGLGEAFKEKQLHFTKYEAQDELKGDRRHGNELVTESKAPPRLDKNLVLRLIQPIDIMQENADVFNNERQILYDQLCNATNYEDHWNRLMRFIDIDEFRNLIFSHQGNHINQSRTQAFQNFHRNLVHVLTFASQNSSCLPNCLNPRPTLHELNLFQDLNRLRREVLGEVVVAS